MYIFLINYFLDASKMETYNNKLLNAFTRIGSKLRASKMQVSKLRGIKSYVNLVCRELNVDETECYLLVITFIVQMQTGDMDIDGFTRFLDINSIDSIQYKPQFEKLISRKYILSYGRNNNSFSNFFINRKDLKIHHAIIESILENKPLDGIINRKFDVYEFNKQVSDYIEKRENENINTIELFDLVKDLEEEHKHLSFIKTFKSLKLDIEDRTLLYEMGDDFVCSGCSSLNITLKDIYNSVSRRMNKYKEIVENRSPLFTFKLVTIEEGSFHNDANIEFTEKCRQIMFVDDSLLFVKKNANKNLKCFTDIETKELFFNAATDKQIDFISSSLKQDNFLMLQKRLIENKMNPGVAAIFYGSPGTGKSETAYQLAKATGRDILVVDLSATKSMWFGQSEKKIKEIFTDYAQLCAKTEITPILLFNEADGVLSKRIENQHTSTQQTENTIQNILLDEFEKNKGIILATTNLEKNLDPAFERRFLFKVKFEKPDMEVRKKIWRSKMSWISDEVLDKIVSQYNFTGGEIDNISRKVIMHEVTTGSVNDSAVLIEFCESEKFENQKDMQKLGFY